MTKTVEVSLPSHRSEQMSVVSKRGSISLQQHAKLNVNGSPSDRYNIANANVCFARSLVRQTDREGEIYREREMDRYFLVVKLPPDDSPSTLR